MKKMKKNILERIAATKRIEVEALKKSVATEKMREAAGEVKRVALSLRDSVRDREVGIIAEHKRRSPSKGEIAPMSDVAYIAETYAMNGAAGMSVLTDTPYFGGALADLAVASSLVTMPLLRKDFTISEYQIAQARIYGASAILLIAAVLTADEMQRFTDYAHSLGLEVLVEVHNAAELDKLPDGADMVGVNNRDLTTFRTDPALSLHIASILPDKVVKVAESGLTSMDEVRRLRDAGYRGFLIGETFMRHDNPADALKRFIDGTLQI